MRKSILGTREATAPDTRGYCKVRRAAQYAGVSERRTVNDQRNPLIEGHFQGLESFLAHRGEGVSILSPFFPGVDLSNYFPLSLAGLQIYKSMAAPPGKMYNEC